MYALGLITLKKMFQSEPTNPDVPDQAQKTSVPTSPTLAVGLLLTKGVRFKFRAFLTNSLRTREPPQLMRSWKRCRGQQLLRWSAETAKLPSATRQLQRASPRLCKRLSESITHLSLFWARRNIPLVLFLQPHRKKTGRRQDAILAVKGEGSSWLPADSRPASAQRGKLGAGGSAAAKGLTENHG